MNQETAKPRLCEALADQESRRPETAAAAKSVERDIDFLPHSAGAGTAAIPPCCRRRRYLSTEVVLTGRALSVVLVSSGWIRNAGCASIWSIAEIERHSPVAGSRSP